MNNFDEPIEGEICGMPMESYAITVQLLLEADCITPREVRQITSYVELDKDNPQFVLELPKLIHRACLRWIAGVKDGTIAFDDDAKDVDLLVRKLLETTDQEIRKAVS
jgi:hypothetical protein